MEPTAQHCFSTAIAQISAVAFAYCLFVKKMYNINGCVQYSRKTLLNELAICFTSWVKDPSNSRVNLETLARYAQQGGSFSGFYFFIIRQLSKRFPKTKTIFSLSELFLTCGNIKRANFNIKNYVLQRFFNFIKLI